MRTESDNYWIELGDDHGGGPLVRLSEVSVVWLVDFCVCIKMRGCDSELSFTHQTKEAARNRYNKIRELLGFRSAPNVDA